MRSVARWPPLTAIIGLLIVMWGAHRINAQRGLSITVPRLYTGPDGEVRSNPNPMNQGPSAPAST
jgi:hypothetical protein